MHIVTGANEEHNCMIKLAFKVKKNEDQFEALLDRLAMGRALGQVVISYVRGDFSTKGKKLKIYLQFAGEDYDFFHYFHIEQIPRWENQEADKLV